MRHGYSFLGHVGLHPHLFLLLLWSLVLLTYERKVSLWIRKGFCWRVKKCQKVNESGDRTMLLVISACLREAKDIMRRSRIMANWNIWEYLDMYDTAKQAAKAYDAAAIELGRSLAKLNFPKKVPPGYTPTNNGQRSTNTSGYRGVSKRKYGYQ